MIANVFVDYALLLFLNVKKHPHAILENSSLRDAAHSDEQTKHKFG